LELGDSCKGVILFSRVGKSGFIAQKICQTLVSTGTKSVFLSPTDALHATSALWGQRTSWWWFPGAVPPRAPAG
jgi:D-arabinose 5-phosphate isomerase GutQ